MRKLSRAGAARRFEITALFAGIGGLELGLSRAGHRVSLLCECDPQAIKILQRRFPGVPIVSDVRDRLELLATISPTSELLTAGFPCADLSQAGTKQGLNGQQSGLIRHVLRLLAKRSFEHVLIENVPNWRRLHRGRHMRMVLRALERMGYKWAYRTIDARAFGLPQRRPRIFLYASKSFDPRAVLYVGDHSILNGARALDDAAHGFYWTEGTRGLGWGENCIPALKGGSGIGIASAPAILLTDGRIVTPDVRDAERLQGLPVGWTKTGRGITASVRRAGERRRPVLIGNAVNARVSAWLGRRLRDAKTFEGAVGEELNDDDPMPQAAWFDGERTYAFEIGSWPVAWQPMDLEAFLKYPGNPLSKRATTGFLNRLIDSPILRPSRIFIGKLKAHARACR